MTHQELTTIETNAAAGTPISAELALAVLKAAPAHLPRLFAAAAGLTQRRLGTTVHLRYTDRRGTLGLAFLSDAEH